MTPVHLKSKTSLFSKSCCLNIVVLYKTPCTAALSAAIERRAPVLGHSTRPMREGVENRELIGMADRKRALAGPRAIWIFRGGPWLALASRRNIRAVVKEQWQIVIKKNTFIVSSTVTIINCDWWQWKSARGWLKALEDIERYYDVCLKGKCSHTKLN